MKDDSLSINIQHRPVVFVTETSSKLASTISQKWLTIFAKKVQIFRIFPTVQFLQISPACRLNAYQIMDGETLDF